MALADDDALRCLAAARRLAWSLLAASDRSDPLPVRSLDAAVARLLNALDERADARGIGLESIRDEQRLLTARLAESGLLASSALQPFEPTPAYSMQFDGGFEGVLGSGSLRGVRSRDGDEISIAGLAGVPMRTRAAASIAESVLTSVRQRPERPLLIVLDEGCDTTGVDESSSLSEYLVHLARALAWARGQAVAVNVWLFGPVSAASYVACAASATCAIAFPDAVLRFSCGGVHAREALRASATWAAAGLVDAIAQRGERVRLAWNGAI